MSATTPRLETQPREKIGSRYAKRLREAGRVPAVIYGHGHEPVHASVDARELASVVEHHAHVVEVTVDGGVTPCLLKDVQYDYLNRDPVHVDLAIVNLDEEVEVEVGLDLIGEAIGLKTAGAMLDQQIVSLTIRCKARDIPEVLTHDISGLEVDHQLLVSEITLPAGIVAVDDADTLIAQVVVRKEQPEPTPLGDAGSDAAEPAVIEKGKKEEDGEK